MTNPPVITKFCITHIVDTSTDTYDGFIGSAIYTREGGKTREECVTLPIFPGQFYGRFFAVSPMIRPIPSGLQLFCALQAESHPFRTIAVKHVIDMFNLSELSGQCTYFMAYNQPVPNTVPLYLHHRGEHFFPSFDRDPPTDDPMWTRDVISPIYVFTPESVGLSEDKMGGLKFRGVNGRCLPLGKTAAGVFGAGERSLSLRDCATLCNTGISDKDFKGSETLLRDFEYDESKPKGGVPTFVYWLAAGVVIAGVLIILWLVKRRSS